MMEKRFLTVFVLVLGLTATMAIAAGGNLAGSLEAFRVIVTEKGVEDFLPADNARPDDVIEYRLTYTNTGDEPVQNIYITDPIPIGTEFVHPSATELDTGAVDYSIDGGKTYHPWPILVKKTNENGEEEMVEATPDMVTHIRWALAEPIQPEQGITVTYRTVIK